MDATADEQWAQVSRATQLAARRRTPRRRLQDTRRNGLRFQLGILLVRVGLRLAEPLTVDHLTVEHLDNP